MTKALAASFLLLAVAAQGCGAESEDVSSCSDCQTSLDVVSLAQNPGATGVGPALAPSVIIDKVGDEWVKWVAAPDDGTEIDWVAAGIPPVPWTELPTAAKMNPQAMTATMKAELMRPMALLNGHWYVRKTVQPNVPFTREPIGQGFEGGLEPEYDFDLSDGPSWAVIYEPGCGGSSPCDSRTKADEELYPTSAIVSIGFTSSTSPTQSSYDSQCTATLIGPSTALTAAHCTNSAINAYAVKPDASESANPYPYGITPGCMTITRSAGYVTAQAAGIDPAPWDYSVVEFDEHPTLGQVPPIPDDPPLPSCHSRPGAPLAGVRPGNVVGYFGYYVNIPDSTIAINNSCVFGFPGDKQPGGGDWPELWGTCGLPFSATGNGVLVDHTVDTGPGQSGAALWYYNSSGIPLLYATHRGGHPATHNTAKRLDSNYANFILANGQW